MNPAQKGATRKIELAVGESIEVVVDGKTISVEHGQDAGGESFVELGGQDCNLEGDAPGIYYPTAL